MNYNYAIQGAPDWYRDAWFNYLRWENNQHPFSEYSILYRQFGLFLSILIPVHVPPNTNSSMWKGAGSESRACIQNNYVKNPCSNNRIYLFASLLKGRLIPWIQCVIHEKGWFSVNFSKSVDSLWK